MFIKLVNLNIHVKCKLPVFFFQKYSDKKKIKNINTLFKHTTINMKYNYAFKYKEAT